MIGLCKLDYFISLKRLRVWPFLLQMCPYISIIISPVNKALRRRMDIHDAGEKHKGFI